MVRDEKTRASLIQLQEELEEVMDAYFNARMGGASKEDVQRAIRDAVSAAETRHQKALGEMRADYRSLKADNADLRAILRSRLTAPIGEDEKKNLTGLAGTVAELMVALLPGAAAMTDEQRLSEWQVKFADLIQDTADRVGAGGRPWRKMTAFEGAEARSHLERMEEKLTRRVLRLQKKDNAPGPVKHPRQLKLVA